MNTKTTENASATAEARVKVLQQRIIEWRNDYLNLLAERKHLIKQIAQAEAAVRGNIVPFRMEVAQ